MYIFDNKDFDATDFISCVKRGMQLIENRKEQMEEEGHEFPVKVSSCQ